MQISHPLLEASQISLCYQNGSKKTMALENVNLAVVPYKLNVLWGPNGAGKSSLLKTLVGFIKADAGQIKKSAQLKFAYLPQKKQLNLDLPLTVLEVVQQGLNKPLLSKISPAEAQEINGLLQFAGIAHLRERLVSQISGGELQKTLLTRALATQPDLLVLDEPLNSLDHSSKTAIMDFLKKLTTQNKTILISLHDLDLIKIYADQLFYIDKTIKFSGSTQKVLSDVFNS